MSTAPAPERVLRIGLAGAGWVTRYHLPAWRLLGPRATVIAIADPALDAARTRASEFGIGSVHESVEAMLENVQLDALDVATPRETHAPICRLAAEHGVPVLCQKPLAPTLPEAEKLVTDLRGRVRLMVHENWRFRPHYRTVRRWLEDGRVGDVQNVSMALHTSGLLPDEDGALPALVRQPMLANLERMLLMEVLIHHVDTLRFLLGPLVLERATVAKRCAAIRGEDLASLLLRTAAGATVSVGGDFMAEGHPAQAFDRLEITGTRGTIRLYRDQLTLLAEPGQAIRLDLDADYEASYLGAITHFVDRLTDGAPFETSPEDNLETLRIIEAAYTAAAQR